MFIASCFAAFFLIVQPALRQESAIRLGADSETYLAAADLLRHGGTGGAALIGLGSNLLGPVAVALIFKTALLITLFNLLLFCIAIYAAGSIAGVNRGLFVVLLILNAATLVDVVTLNKEILSLFSVALFAKYLYSERRSRWLLLVVLTSALLARWQQFAIVLLFLYLRRKASFFGKRPVAALGMVVVLLTLSYPILLSRANLSAFTSQGEGGGAITFFNALQAHFLYPVVLLPKVAMSLFGRLLTPRYFLDLYWEQDFSDLQNQVIQHLHTIAMFMVCLAIVARGRFRIREPLIYFTALYLIVTSINPFIQPRYEYPIYVLLCLELARDAKFRSPANVVKVAKASLWPKLRLLPRSKLG